MLTGSDQKKAKKKETKKNRGAKKIKWKKNKVDWKKTLIYMKVRKWLVHRD